MAVMAHRVAAPLLLLVFAAACEPPPPRSSDDFASRKRAKQKQENADFAREAHEERQQEAARPREAPITPEPRATASSSSSPSSAPPARSDWEQKMLDQDRRATRNIWHPSDGADSPCCKDHGGGRECRARTEVDDIGHLRTFRDLVCVDGTLSPCGC